MNAQSKIEAATLAGAMALAFGKIEAATKSANNPHFKSKYADLGAVIEAIKPALIDHDLFYLQHCHPADNGVCVETVLYHACGEHLSLGKLFVPANKQDAQGFGSALTYARRYGLVTAFGVPTEDDDGNAAAASPRATPRTDPAPEPMVTAAQRFDIEALSRSAQVDMKQILGRARVDDLGELTEAAAFKVIKQLNATLKTRKPVSVENILDDEIPF